MGLHGLLQGVWEGCIYADVSSRHDEWIRILPTLRLSVRLWQTVHQLVEETASLNEVMVSRSRDGRSYTLCSTIPYRGGMPHAMMTDRPARFVFVASCAALHVDRRTGVLCYSVKEQSLHRMDDNWHNFCHSEVSVFRGFFRPTCCVGSMCGPRLVTPVQPSSHPCTIIVQFYSQSQGQSQSHSDLTLA
jgi:hypothetical protein